MDREGYPDIIPSVELSDKPIGSDPKIRENDRSSPLTEGVIENSSFFDRE